jgi:biotin carboxyl carrier protein
MKYITIVNDQQYIIEIGHEGQIEVDGQKYEIDFEQLSEGGILSLLLNNRSFEAIVEEREQDWEVLIHGELYTVFVQDEQAYRLAKERGVTSDETGEAAIKSPMPGLIIAIPVEVGQAVKKGDKVVILESMKMENELRSPKDGLVANIYVEPGASVEKNQILMAIGDLIASGEMIANGDHT